MALIIHYREKCIGCNACVEIAFDRWRMSKKDGKATLLKAKNKKGIYTISISEDEVAVNKLAAKNCPPKIIKVLDSHPY